MKLNCTLFYFIFLLFLVSNTYGQKKHKKNLPHTVNVLDTSISGIKFDNVKHVYDSLSGMQTKSIEVSYSNSQDNTPFFDFTNTSQTEYLNFSSSNKSANTSCYRFKVSYKAGRSNNSETGIVKNPEFITENGIYLGMAITDFLSKYSSKRFDKIQLGEFVIYRFYGDEQIDSASGTPSYNYIALYKFYNNTLVEFLFGKYDKGYNYMRDIMDGNSLYLKYQDVTQF